VSAGGLADPGEHKPPGTKARLEDFSNVLELRGILLLAV
jgi:hypothetical protein